ncbi:YcjF family protein [Synechococcus sp. Tobar12-5m-g]|nr:YcjF family protein [Synechococcus sp. Tobar12-5m-g]MCP9874550.1 YcjF family protein [Synechococcus sp. Cruz CV-v-12]
MAGGWWWLCRGRRTMCPALPQTCEAWFRRCDGLLLQFERLEAAGPAGEHRSTPAQRSRRERLERLRRRQDRRQLELAVVGVTLPSPSLQPVLLAALRGALPLALHWGHPLPASSPNWRWPAPFAESDQLLYCLGSSLGGADLRWLDSLPAQQPVWLLVTSDPADGERRLAQEAELRAQLPARLGDRLLFWGGAARELHHTLEPLRQHLQGGGQQQLIATDLRCLETLHLDWQRELEVLRRQRLRPLVQRTQWLVAASVVVAPLPSLDLLVLAVANGVMLQEMARLWDCPWGADQLREAALELAKAALALGVAEWSSQALLTLMRLEASTWLVGSALQALSAAYLTRVVARAMADVMALSSGLPETDLAELRRQAPLLVARAAEAERLDWSGFLAQARTWLAGGGAARSPADQTPSLQASS